MVPQKTCQGKSALCSTPPFIHATASQQLRNPFWHTCYNTAHGLDS